MAGNEKQACTCDSSRVGVCPISEWVRTGPTTGQYQPKKACLTQELALRSQGKFSGQAEAPPAIESELSRRFREAKARKTAQG